ncbi:MAG: prepilin-type N-terminal cleavage/methylation domain-containing protein [Bdellovibrio sp.]|nr:prepilin-type N-terminal cleavage/methylation domain-containing protein [Bdellovibrio sp.]
MRNNQKGFTLTEMIIGVALLGIMGLVAASFFVFTAKTKTDISNEIEDKVDSIIAERMILKDLKYSEPSFNNLLVKDDFGNLFFDYVSDVTEGRGDEGPRQLTLSLGGRTEFVFMVTNQKLGATMMYTPALAYDIGNPPTNPNIAATLTFRSLNKKEEVAKANPNFWQEGTLLMLDSPAAVREMTSTGPNYSRPARSPMFVGVVKATGESVLGPLDIPNFLDRTNPLYPNETIDNEDELLRELPPLGGAAPLVRLKAVSIIKYYLERDTRGNNKVNLFRSVYGSGGFQEGQLFAADIQKVVFARKSARDALIYYSIVRPDAKKGN